MRKTRKMTMRPHQTDRYIKRETFRRYVMMDLTIKYNKISSNNQIKYWIGSSNTIRNSYPINHCINIVIWFTL